MSATDVGYYASGVLYADAAGTIKKLRASGTTTVIAWALHVHPNGDLVFNDTTIISDGDYVGDPDWPAQLASLKQSPTSVQRLYFSIGGWEVPDFENIQQLIKQQGTGPDSILSRNFTVLKKLGPDGIDYDDESLYDTDTTVEFSSFLNGLGFEVSFCPYTDTAFWVGCLKLLYDMTPDLVTRFNLQCYAGGLYNDPAEWIAAIAQAMPPNFDAAGFVSPGLMSRVDSTSEAGCCPGDVVDKLGGWRPSQIQGAWMWNLDTVVANEKSGLCSGPMGTDAYAKAIMKGLSG